MHQDTKPNSPTCPEHAALLDFSGFGHIEVGADVPEAAVEDPAFAVPAFPNDRHHGAVDPRSADAVAERRRGQHFVAGIHVHVILLAAHPKIRYAARDRIVVPALARITMFW